MSFVSKIENNNIYLVRGKDKGQEAWHFVQVEKNKIPLFLSEIKSGHINVNSFGKILFSGWGKNPPTDIVEKVKLWR